MKMEILVRTFINTYLHAHRIKEHPNLNSEHFKATGIPIPKDKIKDALFLKTKIYSFLDRCFEDCPSKIISKIQIKVTECYDDGIIILLSYRYNKREDTE